MLRGDNEQIVLTLADAAKDTLVGWDTNNDGMIFPCRVHKGL